MLYVLIKCLSDEYRSTVPSVLVPVPHPQSSQLQVTVPSSVLCSISPVPLVEFNTFCFTVNLLVRLLVARSVSYSYIPHCALHRIFNKHLLSKLVRKNDLISEKIEGNVFAAMVFSLFL